jgi:hypothetical protein
MDAQSFDALTRRFTTELPRRGALAVMTGAVFSSLVLGRASPVAAGCKKVGKKCEKNKDCCDGAKCKKDKCKCKSGRQECGGKCYYLDRDENHCGNCNIQCEKAEGEICSNGNCVNVPS